MVGSSKILTVSYGTFSCTLEGFDDSFDTMKAIAEYFRDLAADDRYFGAEPPTPDAEMLARIAEREVARRVQAHEEQGKIVLRAEAGEALGQAVALTDAPTAKAPEAEAKASEPAPEETSAAPESAPVEEDSPVDMAEAAHVETPEGLEEEQPEIAADQESEVETAAQPVPAEEEPAQAAVTEIEVAEVEVAEVSLDQDRQEEPAVLLEGDSIAAKLSRIRSVVSDAESFGDDEYSEDEHANDFVDTTVADLNAALAEDDLDAILARATAEDAVEDETGAASEEFDAPGEMDAQAMAEDDEAFDVPKEFGTDSEFEDTLASLLTDSMPEDAPTAEAVAEAPEIEAEDVAQAEDEADPESAHVIKIKRAEFEAAVASGLFQEDDADDDQAEIGDGNIFEDEGAFLSPEEEAELQRELAEVEAEFEGVEANAFDALEDEAEDKDEEEIEAAQQDVILDDDSDDFEDEAAIEPEVEVASEETDAQQPEQRRYRLERAETSSDLTRIFDETDNQLDAPASSQRRNAIQHLRAAVAATRAETKAGSELRRGVDDSAYRDDLANVVRPRRPQALSEAGRSARPEETRPAPLKLVAEQRIDAPRDPIRPRRVLTSDIAPAAAKADSNSGFSAFAEEMGATQLPELLEAAAAYLADVEGRPQFSRPILMGKLKEIEQENFSREDGLRSFGQLLREGKLQKLAGGRFSVTEETDYRGQGARHVG